MKSEYQLFLHDVSGKHEPIAAFISDAAFPSLIIGQRFDDHGWDRLRGVGVIASEEEPIRYTVQSVKIIIFVESGRNIIQTGVNLEPYSAGRSPAFGNTDPTMTWKEALDR